MLNLTMQEAERYKVISEVEEGYLKVKEAAGILGLSERQVYRIKARVEREGAGGVIHKSKGKNTPLWLNDKKRDKIDHLYKTKYRGFNLTHMTEFLNEEEGIKVSPANGGKVAGAKFVLADGVKQNMEVFKDIVQRRGIPLSVYVDCGSNFKTTRYQSTEYQLKGEYPNTQFARALGELDIRIIYAYSPQAKGRIERKFGVFQDRLCSELRLHNISTQEEANRYLGEKFIPKHNRMFARTAKEPGSAYRSLPKGLNLKDVFCLKEERTAAGDNTISYNARVFQILPNEYRLSYCKAKVEVHEYLDGSINIFYQGKKLKHKPISKEKIKSFQSLINQKENQLLTINY